MKQHDADDLTQEQVIDRLKPAQNPQSIDELYSFGSSLLAETRERTSRIESKATSMMVWSVALLAFIFSRVDSGKVIFHSPQGSLQNRPYGVTSKAAMGRFRDLDVVLCRLLFGQV
jgi:hypothetical protein